MKNIFYHFFVVILLFTLTSCGNKTSSVMEFEGNVTIIRGEKNAELSAKEGMRVKNKDVVLTGALSNTWLRLNDASMILLDELSKLSISNNKGSISLILESGMVLVRIDRPLKTHETFDIVIGNTSISVRGTAFSTQIEDEHNALLNVYHGSVAVCKQSGSELITLTKGESLRFDPVTGVFKEEVAPINFQMLPDIVFKYLEDYAKESTNETDLSTPIDLSSNVSDISDLSDDTITDEITDATTPDTEVDGTDITTLLEPYETEQQLNTASIPSEIQVTPQNLNMPNQKIKATIAPGQPSVSFKYLWSDTEYKPYTDIFWATDKVSYIIWQFYDKNNNALAANGRFDSNDGGIFLTDHLLDVSSPIGNNLYPEGYTIRMTPYYMPEQGANALPLDPIIMHLPYFDVAAEQTGEVLRPVISTNIGFYFKHSYENLTETKDGDGIRIKGDLIPIDGAKIPLTIDVLAKVHQKS